MGAMLTVESLPRDARDMFAERRSSFVAFSRPQLDMGFTVALPTLDLQFTVRTPGQDMLIF